MDPRLSKEPDRDEKGGKLFPVLVPLDGKNFPRVKITGTGNKRYVCAECATWVCDRCGSKRQYANRSYPHGFTCPKCKWDTGGFRAVYHTRQQWFMHNELDPESGLTNYERRMVDKIEDFMDAESRRQQWAEHGRCEAKDETGRCRFIDVPHVFHLIVPGPDPADSTDDTRHEGCGT